MADTTIGLGGAILLAIFLGIYFTYRRSLTRTKRLLAGLLNRYFDGDLPADQVGQRAGEIASAHFLRSGEFYSLAVAAFQSAADAKLTRRSHSVEDESTLLRLFAALKREFGLTDRYQSEGWRAGRE
ncbi:MAG TPA: hypothetical protein VGH40_04025 [Roseiarcus sp.]|jgi:hypothetical protein